MEGNNNVTNNVFGGGNQAATGTESNNNSKSTVNIVGATVGKMYMEELIHLLYMVQLKQILDMMQ